MRLRIVRNLGFDIIREFAEKSATLPNWQEGDVVEAEDKIGEALISRALAETTTDPIKAAAPPAAAPQMAPAKGKVA